jgi:hypothetical protein
VNTMEDRLRDAYRAAADTVPSDSLPDLGVQVVRPARRRRRRPQFALPAVAAVATAAVVAATVMLAPHAATRPATTIPTRPAAAVSPLPPYTVAVDQSTLFVYKTTSGAITGTVNAPSGQQFEQVTADGNDRTFLVSTSLITMADCAATFYRLQLSADGTPGQLTQVLALNGYTPAAMTVAGGRFAYSVAHCATGSGHLSNNPVIGYVAAGGRHWTFTLSEDYASALALSPKTGMLAFPMFIPGSGLNQEGLVLSTASPSGPIASTARVALRVQGTLEDVTISPDGTTLYGCSVAGSTATLASYDTATGHRTAVLGSWQVSTKQLAYCHVTLDSSGRYLLAALAATTPAATSPATDAGPVTGTTVTAYRLGSLTPTKLPFPLADGENWGAIAW